MGMHSGYGPGFDLAASQLPGALKHATDEASELEGSHATPAPTLNSHSSAADSEPAHGEGIGLSIVKHLCELLDASLEFETAPGAGTTFRVTFPERYSH